MISSRYTALVGTNSILYEKVDVISTWVYRQISNASFESYGNGTAVNLMQSLFSAHFDVGSQLRRATHGLRRHLLRRGHD